MDFKANIKSAAVQEAVREATREGLRDTIVAVHDSVLQIAINKGIYATGNNNRSIATEVSGMGQVAGDAGAQRMVDDSKLEAVVYSTSGYGGYLEIGTAPHVIRVRNASVLTDGTSFFGKEVNHPGTKARPYFRPALDLHSKELIPNIKKRLNK
jgi:hypothetical protein